MSLLGGLNYSYDNRYLLTESLRADGSSKFADGERWGVLHSAAFAWRISEEKFMQDAKAWLSNLKLRVSFGEAGNCRIGDNLWRYVYATSTPSKPYGVNGNEQTIISLSSSLPNPRLKWETTITRNAGLDFGFFGGRLSGTVDLYWNTTNDLLIRASIPASSGF